MKIKLSPAQKLFLAELEAVPGNRGIRCPFVGGRNAKIIASAFHRTAQSLKNKGLVLIEREGDSIRVFPVYTRAQREDLLAKGEDIVAMTTRITNGTWQRA